MYVYRLYVHVYIYMYMCIYTCDILIQIDVSAYILLLHTSPTQLVHGQALGALQDMS